MKWKAFFVIFEGLTIARNCLRPTSGPLAIRASAATYITGTEKTALMNASYMKKLKEEFRLSDMLPTFKINSQTSRLGLLITTKILCC